MRKSRRLARAATLSKAGSPPLKSDAVPRVTRAAQAHATALEQQSRASRRRVQEIRLEGDEAEGEAEGEEGAVQPSGDEAGSAAAVAEQQLQGWQDGRGASTQTPVRVH